MKGTLAVSVVGDQRGVATLLHLHRRERLLPLYGAAVNTGIICTKLFRINLICYELSYVKILGYVLLMFDLAILTRRSTVPEKMPNLLKKLASTTS